MSMGEDVCLHARLLFSDSERNGAGVGGCARQGQREKNKMSPDSKIDTRRTKIEVRGERFSGNIQRQDA